MTNRPENTRPLTGHALANEGAPHDNKGNRINPYSGRFQYTTASGEGRAKCQCGELSDILPSRNARARWHRNHKMTVKNQEK